MDGPSQDRGRCTDCGRIVPIDSLIEHTIEERPGGFIGLCRECGPVDVASAIDPRPTGWYLEHLVEGDHSLRRIDLYPFPFRVGRLPGLNLTINSDAISKLHAELLLEDGQLRVIDLKSKNGTFVNKERVVEAELTVGDIVHFADLECRIGYHTECDDRAIPIRWDGEVVGFIGESCCETTEIGRDVKWSGYWKPCSGSKTLPSFLAQLNWEGRTKLDNHTLFTLNRQTGEAWLYSW